MQSRLARTGNDPADADRRETSTADGVRTDAAAARQTVVINGERMATRTATLAELLVEAGYAGAKVATALNGDFVAERNRSQTRLSEGDQIEIVAPRQGG